MTHIHEPARETPVIAEADVCVAGGSATGVCAAVAAARAGAQVVLVERYGFFGGVATAGLVNVWHSLSDTEGAIELIRGLTREILDRLEARSAASKNEETGTFALDTEELKIELDLLLAEAGVNVMLHSWVADAAAREGTVEAAMVETKSGRGAIRAKVFIDATGDGDLAARAGFAFEQSPRLQPPTTCVRLAGLPEGLDIKKVLFRPENRDRLPAGFLWHARVPGRAERMVAGTRAFGADCSDAASFTRAELEGRRQVRAMMDILRATPGCEDVRVSCLAPQIGVRETRRIVGLHVLTEKEVLDGARFPDAIANGSYCVDIHRAGGEGLTFRHLDGREVFVGADGSRKESRWRAPRDENPTFYQIPCRSLVPRGSRNLLVAGRCISVDSCAFGATRVMVNCNQTGQAAGAAAALAARKGVSVAEVDAEELRKLLAEQGAVVI